jgi:hypothetical protein
VAGADREVIRVAATSAALAVVLGAVGWLGLSTGHLAGRPPPEVASTPASAPTAAPSHARPAPRVTPTPTVSLMAPDPELLAAFDAQVRALGGEYALAWVDHAGLHVLGRPPAETAWSTIKVPLAVAALRRPAQDTERHVDEAITRSDNAAALALWTSLGRPEQAAAAVDEVLRAYGSPETRTQSADLQPPYSPFGQTTWPLSGQARFAAALSCAPGWTPAGRVHSLMAGVVPDQRWGIGRLDDAHLKGGWGPDPGGAYVLRQLGTATVEGQTYALALSARTPGGTYAEAAAGSSALVRWWTETAVPDAAGFDCP